MNENPSYLLNRTWVDDQAFCFNSLDTATPCYCFIYLDSNPKIVYNIPSKAEVIKAAKRVFTKRVRVETQSELAKLLLKELGNGKDYRLSGKRAKRIILENDLHHSQLQIGIEQIEGDAIGDAC